MVRYTSPTLNITLDCDLSEARRVRVSLADRHGVNEIYKDVSVFDTENNTLTASFSQAETATFPPGVVRLQCRVLFKDGSVLATNIMELVLVDSLNQEVLSL